MKKYGGASSVKGSDILSHKILQISTVDLSYVVTVKSTVEISQSFVAFSEYMNFKDLRLF